MLTIQCNKYSHCIVNISVIRRNTYVIILNAMIKNISIVIYLFVII